MSSIPELTVHVISHTHWDREWYRTKQEFRVELVAVVDAVLEALERDEGFRCFTLDGQSILLEDYLSIRPEQRGTIERMVSEGRLLIGPWYTQPDEFLVSGESLVRNLQAGIGAAQAYGGAMPVGWVPDSFGHIGQLPQILRQFGIACAALTRGIGNELPDMQTDFEWASPDGSTVTVAHQVQGYYSGGLLGFPYFWGSIDRHPPSAEIARERLTRLLEPHSRYARTCHVALWNGADHLHPEPDLGRTLAQLDEGMPDHHIIHSSVQQYIRGVRNCSLELPTVRGELRGSRYHALLPSILSTRIYLKQRNAEVQRLLTRHTEPVAALAALMSPIVGEGHARYRYPGAELGESWKLLLQNHGHDSIGGCSIDQVHREMMPRFDQAEQVADAVRRRALMHLRSALTTSWVSPDTPAFLCFNPHDRASFQVVAHEFVWSRDISRNAQVVNAEGSQLPTQAFDAEEDEYAWLRQQTSVRDVLDNLWWWSEVLNRMDRLGIQRYEIDDDGVSIGLTLFLADEAACSEETVAELLAVFRDRRVTTPVSIRALLYRHKLLFETSLPALGITAYAVRTISDEQGRRNPQAFTVSVQGRELHFSGNRLWVNEDGSLGVITQSGRRLRRLFSLYDEGDRGDSYDFCPVDGDVPEQLRPIDAVRVTPLEQGPVRAALEVSFDAALPVGVCEDRRRRQGDRVALPVTLRVSVEMGSDTVFVTGTLDNTARDHRIRLHLEPEVGTRRVFSGGQFSVNERSTDPPDTSDWAQAVTDIQPHQDWVGLGDEERAICLFTDGLHEHEAIRDDAGEARGLAVTVLRSVGYLSRGDLTTRRGQAGPMIPTPDAQCIRTCEFVCGFELFSDEENMLRSVSSSAGVFLRSRTAAIPAGQEGVDTALSLLRLDASDFVLTAVKGSIAAPGAVVVRFFNAAFHSVSQRVELSPLIERAQRVGLDESLVEELWIDDGFIEISAAPHEIVTLRLERRDQRTA